MFQLRCSHERPSCQRCIKQGARCEYPQINERRKVKKPPHHRQTGLNSQRRLHSAVDRELLTHAAAPAETFSRSTSTILPRTDVVTAAVDSSRRESPSSWGGARPTVSSVADPDNQQLESSPGSLLLQDDQVHLMRQASIPTDVSCNARKKMLSY